MTSKKRFPWRLFSRIVFMQILLILFALAGTGIAARFFFKKNFLYQTASQLQITLGTLSRDLPQNPSQSWCENHAYDKSLRLTVIARDGLVLCDTHHDPASMENHLGRPEIQEALSAGFGQTIRLSTTLTEDMFYGALFVSERNVFLRGAISLTHLAGALNVFDVSLTVFLVTIALILLGLALWFGRQIALPIGRLIRKAQQTATAVDEQDSVGSEDYGELTDLESSIDDIHRELHSQTENLSRERGEQAVLMSSISDAILAVDLNGTPLFYNSRFALKFNQTLGTKNGQMQLWEIFRNPQILELFNQALKEGKSSSLTAFEFVTDNGKDFFSVSIAPLKENSGKAVYGAVGIFHDVTELKKTEQMRMDFVSNVSHELRTPLTAIKGYVDTLSADIQAQRPVSKEFFDVIVRNTTRLMDLTRDLLDLSSLESNAEDLHKAQLDTDEISRHVIKQLQNQFEQKAQTLDLKIGAFSVFADASRVEQVLVNLLDNACKYTPQGGRILIGWEAGPDHKDVFLRVIDSGPGIPVEHRERLFERFYRIDKARSRELGGTGLGLAIVKHIMHRHGGSVWTEDPPTGQAGACFVCRFPSG